MGFANPQQVPLLAKKLPVDKLLGPPFVAFQPHRSDEPLNGLANSGLDGKFCRTTDTEIVKVLVCVSCQN